MNIRVIVISQRVDAIINRLRTQTFDFDPDKDRQTLDEYFDQAIALGDQPLR